VTEADSSAATRAADAEMWEQRAAQTTEVADAIRAAEKVSRELQAAAKVGVGAQIGTILTRKGLKVADVVTKWDTSMDGVIDRNEFRAHVEALGVEVSSASEIDALFDELDADGGGSLDAAEVKRALRVLQEEAEAAKVSKRSLCEQTIIACRAAKAALASFRTRKEAEEAAAAEEASKAALAAERVAVAAAEAKAARERAMEEKRAEAAAAAAAFKAKVEEKRLKRG